MVKSQLSCWSVSCVCHDEFQTAPPHSSDIVPCTINTLFTVRGKLLIKEGNFRDGLCLVCSMMSLTVHCHILHV
jgi:hypothetical protein